MHDVIVVGAGVAGLTAATKLVHKGLDVLVLEARDRVGGRTLNAPIPDVDGAVVEMGGQWVGPGQHRVLGLLAELDLKTFPTYDDGEHIIEFHGRRVQTSARIPFLGAVTLADIGQTQLRLGRQLRGINPAEPWHSRDAIRLDGETFASWIRRTARTKGGRTFFEIICHATFSADPSEISALWALSYFASAGGLDPLINTRGGAQDARVVGGSQRIAELLAERLGEAVRTECPVHSIRWDGGQVLARSGSEEFVARAAVLAVPPPLVDRIAFEPALPVDHVTLRRRLPMGSVLKINVVYDEPFWRAAGLSGQFVSDHRLTNMTFDNSPQHGEVGVLVAFSEGPRATALAKLGPAHRRAAVLDDLAEFFGPRARSPRAYLEQDWTAEQWSLGGYGAFATPGALTRYGPLLREPVGPLHWAGAETATEWTGYIDGAIQSGERAATEVLARLG
ncbi:NAD(P)-binding protein [Solihabitans fulvus]|uniref:NAD(P)-binding protein n=1 Tax=Solihabitans fulvus TaxID=1892852 RepID=A0A5B2XL64_9PSEU|nr:FAD-dependent oxidoreductase [Solihabitans fulvus]KAA2264608.1 NAD(P)-binding protein [Solihabitans fulvus]